MRPLLGNDLNLGFLAGRKAKLRFPRELRDKHLYVCGGTGTGKSKFLENLIRQDIEKWSKSKCGVLVLDPHGNLYDNLINWLAWTKFDRPIIPIDLRQDDWVISYNLLRKRKSADQGVVVANIISAMAHVWGQAGTDATPQFEQWAGNFLNALYENNLSLVDAELLFDRKAKDVRQALTGALLDKSSQADWELANTLSPKDFDAQVGSTVRRLRRFLGTQKIRNTFSLSDVSLDLGKVIEEGGIVLVNLATERARISKEDSELFATLLLSDLWTAAQERGKRDRIKPFYVYLDEFQRFVTPTISENLDEARGYGLHLTIAHQFPNQLLDRGDSGRRVYNSIMENASSKVVFRLSHKENLQAMAEWLFMGVMSPDKIKHEMYSTRVLEYTEELRKVYGEIIGTSRSRGTQQGYASGSGSGGTEVYSDNDSFIALSMSESWSSFSSDSSSESESSTESSSSSSSEVPMLIPHLGKELSHVQFESLDEQIFRAIAVLFDQQERQAVARLVGMKAPVSIFTPPVKEQPGSKERTKRFLESCYKKLSFALPIIEARQQIAERAANFAGTLLKEAFDEPPTAKRKIR